MKVPARQDCHGVQLAAFSVWLKALLGQALHSRFEAAVPGMYTYSPAAQVFHGLQVAALVVVL